MSRLAGVTWARLAGATLVAACLAAQSCAELPAPPPGRNSPDSTAAFTWLDFTDYSTWGFGARLQVRADGTALLEGSLREDAWRPHDSPHEPWRVGRVPEPLLADLCRLLDQQGVAGLAGRYVQSNILDGPTMLLEIHTQDAVYRVYEYGMEGPELLHKVTHCLDRVVRDTPWDVWNGTEAEWLESADWMPLEEWHDSLIRDYPPWPAGG